MAPGVAVALRVDGAKGDDHTGFSILVLRHDAELTEVLSATWTGVPHRGSLEPGSYRAVARDTALGFGPVVDFEVVDGPGEAGQAAETAEAIEVVVARPTAFAVRFRVTDATAGGGLSTAAASLRRTDLGSQSRPNAQLDVLASPNGAIEFPAVSGGQWALDVTADGFAPAHFDVDWPGDWSAVVESGKPIDFGDFPLSPLITIPFQLVADRPRLDYAGFEIAHTFNGDRVAFDASGRAELVLGAFVRPLYLAMWYPGDGPSTIFYLHGGLPGDGDAYEIRVETGRTLEVAVTCAPSVLDALTGQEAYVRVSHLNERGDTIVTSAPWLGERAYEFTSVPVADAVVSVATAENSLPIEWTARGVELADEGRTSMALHVAAPPTAWVFVDEEGGPVDQLQWSASQVPDRTGWIGGGETDELGRAKFPRLLDTASQISAYRYPGEWLALGLSTPDATNDGTAQLAMFPRVETYVEVFCSDEPLKGVRVEYMAQGDERDFLADLTNEEGRGVTFSYVSRSRGVFRVLASTHWPLTQALELAPGRNRVDLVPAGWLAASSASAFESMRLLGGNQSVATWVRSGMSRVTTQADGGVRALVPVGEYHDDRIQDPSAPPIVVAQTE